MAKSMAVLEGGKIANIIWCSDEVQETDTLKEAYEKLVQIGDIYDNGEYYRDGKRVLSQLEEMAMAMENMYEALEILGLVRDETRIS